jgi:hypothetical protein
MKKRRSKPYRPSDEIAKRTFCGGPFLAGMTLEDMRERRDLAVHDGDMRLAFALAIEIDRKRGFYP